MALFRKSVPINHHQGITGLTKPAPVPPAAAQAALGEDRGDRTIVVPALAFVIVAALAFTALQGFSPTKQTVDVSSSTVPTPTIAPATAPEIAAVAIPTPTTPSEPVKVANVDQGTNDLELTATLKTLLGKTDAEIAELLRTRPPEFQEVIQNAGLVADALAKVRSAQPNTAPSLPAVEQVVVEQVEQVAAQIQPVIETPVVAVAPEAPEALQSSAAVIEQASAGVWKPETTRVRIGRPVEEAACIGQLRSVARESTIFFGAGGADLTSYDLRTVRVIGRMVEQCPDAIVYITGHSDPSGSREANMLLSWQRADNATRALEDLGFDVSQYEPVGFGARIPYAQGDASDAELERRVEFNIQELLWETR